MADVTEIELGGRKFGIRPLTLRQMRDVQAISVSGMTRRQLDSIRASAAAAALQAATANATDPTAATAAAAKALAQMAPADGGNDDAEAFVRAESDRMVRTIAAALSRDFPEMTAAVIDEMEISPQSLIVPFQTVLALSGLVPAGEVTRNP